MKHRDRKSLVKCLSGLISDVSGAESPDRHEEAIHARLGPLLDAFLLKSQPIEEIEAAILIADIRGFMALTETQSPRTIIRLLDRFFTRMVELVRRNGGAVGKFMGGAVMAVFRSPFGTTTIWLAASSARSKCSRRCCS